MAKFLGFWSLCTASKMMAMLAIIIFAILLFGTDGIPKQSDEEEELTMWRNLDFSISVVSLFFASCLLYGSISEFRLFVLVWMPWNVILITYWIIFLAFKSDELVNWERVFRIISIVLMAYAEIPVGSYVKSLKQRNEDVEAPIPWMPHTLDPNYKTLCESRSISSINSVFVTRKGLENSQQEQDLPSPHDNSSTVSEASEEIEMVEQVNNPKIEISEEENSEVTATVHSHQVESVETKAPEAVVEFSKPMESSVPHIDPVSQTDPVPQTSQPTQTDQPVEVTQF